MAEIFPKKYHLNRLYRKDFKYRLTRKVSEIEKIIKKHAKRDKLKVLDVGTADGLMLSKLNSIFNFEEAIGIDLSKELIKCNKDPKISLRIGNAEDLEFKDDYFDVLIAAAIIEHVDNPKRMLSECWRVLKKGGLLIITTPNPIFHKIAVGIGYERKVGCERSMSLNVLEKLLRGRFRIIEKQYFMLIPFFSLPFFKQIESILHHSRLGFFMVNQLIVGRKFS